MKRLGFFAATTAATILALSLNCEVGAATTHSSETYKALNLFGEVFAKVRTDYAGKTNDHKLIEAAINGMLTALDPHSNYLDAKEFNDMKVETRGEFGGLGIEVSMEGGLIKVVSPIDNTPAAKAGLKPGDLITRLNGKSVRGMTLPQAVTQMRGPIGSKITITIARKGQKPFNVDITRAEIKIESVKSHLVDGNIGYIRISAFSEQTDVGLKRAMAELKKKTDGKLAGIILDLRNNPGGLLDQAVAVANTFIKRGEIVSTRGREEDDDQRFYARSGEDISGNLPMVVLINGGSASASEIVAGALKDHHRAVLVGTRSFGKGSVQTIIPMGAGGAMRLTTARYFTPSGRSIQDEGIKPDIVVPAAKIQVSGPAGTSGAAGSVNAGIMGTKRDYQMVRAVSILHGISLFNHAVFN